MKYKILAFYLFIPIEDPVREMERQLEFLKARDVTSRIYLSEEGMNGQMCARADHAEEYIGWMREDERFNKIDFKVQPYHEHVFPRLTIKVRKQLVALDTKVDISLTGTHVSPQKWKEMMDLRDDDTFLLDVRNDYEWEIGHFEGAELPTLETFRGFREYAEKLAQEKDNEKTKVMMYCTGGIRCEIYSALLKEKGFKQVYQLEGGVVKYGEEVGGDHWLGKLFVFDDRLAVPLEEGGEPISVCCHCKDASDVYYNCANMDCNELFLSCPPCAEKMKGCCCISCQSAPRLRPFSGVPKPFRRAHLLDKV